MKTYQQQYANSDAKNVEKSVKSLVRLQDAQDALEAAELDVVATAEHLEQVELSFIVGDDQHDDLDHAAATSGVRRASLRLQGATKHHQAAQRGLICTDTEVAWAFAPAVESVLPGVPLIVTAAPPESEPTPDQRPVAVVRQVGPTVRKPSGLVSGDVRVTYYRSAIHAPVTSDQFAEAVTNVTDLVVESLHVRPRLGLDEVEVSVFGAGVDLPVISTITKMHAAGVGRRLVSDAMASLRYVHQGLGTARSTHEKYGELLFTVLNELAATTYGHAFEESLDDDVRTVTVAGYITARNGDERGFGDAVTRAVEALDGRFVNGLGRVTSLHVEGVTDAEAYRDAVLVLNGVADQDASKTGYEGDFLARYTATVTSRVYPVR